MINHGKRIAALEAEVNGLKASLNAMMDIIDDMRVATVDHPDYAQEAAFAQSRVRTRGWRIATQRQMVSKAKSLQSELQIMAEDSPEVAKMLLKD
jgi:predicted S18 family serine protease